MGGRVVDDEWVGGLNAEPGWDVEERQPALDGEPDVGLAPVAARVDGDAQLGPRSRSASARANDGTSGTVGSKAA